jgi:hypothetical protein
MVSLPAAVSKVMFDLIWDLFRKRKQQKEGSRSTVPRRIEDGLEMHHVNEAARHRRVHPDLSPDENRQNESTDGIISAVPEILSLSGYLKTHYHGTKLQSLFHKFITTFPTFSVTMSRLPYTLLPFMFSQFILVEALSYTGWIGIFSKWFAVLVGFSIPATVFIVGIASVLLCNVSGTNIGATILLVNLLKHPNFAMRTGLPPKVETAAMLALAVGSNIGAVSFTFSASLAGDHIRSLSDI